MYKQIIDYSSVFRYYFIKMDDIIEKLRALSDPNRYRIAMALMAKPLCVCEILQILEIAGGTLSNHLKILRNAGLILQRKDGKWIEYFIADVKAEKFLKAISAFDEEKEQLTADLSILNSSNRELCSKRARKNAEQ